MCGIAGLFDLTGLRPVPPVRLQGMCAALAHRGPDGQGFFTAPGIGLGHRRLSVVDLAQGGQPMFDAARRTVTVFNGEIYNHPALRRELSAKGHAFRTASDTESLLHAWREWGEEGIGRLKGMFAFALWDFDRHVLHLARDPLGEKPLYYSVAEDGWLVFASEIQAVLQGLGQTPALRPDAVADYFAYGYVPDPKTIYQNVYKLPPGHQLTVRRGRHQDLTPRSYWQLSLEPDGAPLRAEEAAEELTDRLRTSVRERMQADVPLGAFLSGGVDSSGVVAMMAAASDRPVKSCAMGFPDPAFDETHYAALVAAQYGTDHTREEVVPDALSLVDRLAVAYGEPFADASAVPTFLLSRVARQRVTVALSGDGGDEAFAGYRRYPFFLREERLRRMVPAGLRRMVFGQLARTYPKADWAPRYFRAKATFEALSGDRAAGYFRAVTVLPDALRNRLLHPDLRAALRDYHPDTVLRAHFADAGAADPLRAAQYVDMKTWLAGRMLVKVDRASMANSLEVRAPLLDPDLVQFGVSLPERLKLDGFQGKWLLKHALEPMLPRELLYRKKQGFSMPLAAWLRQGLDAQMAAVLDPRGPLAGSNMIDLGFAKRLAAAHRSGQADHSQALWALIMFSAFLAQPQRAAGHLPSGARCLAAGGFAA